MKQRDTNLNNKKKQTAEIELNLFHFTLIYLQPKKQLLTETAIMRITLYLANGKNPRIGQKTHYRHPKVKGQSIFSSFFPHSLLNKF